MPKAIMELETTGDKPHPQYGQSILVRGPFIYAIGGTTGFDYTCDIHRLDLRTYEWECLSRSCASNEDHPKGRYRHEIVQDDEHIYVIGGGTAAEAFALESLPAFHLKSKKWLLRSTKPDQQAPHPGYPGARRCHSCVQYQTLAGETEIVIAGGYFEENIFYDDIWTLNLATMQWHEYKSARLPNPMYFHDAATSGNGLMYIFGGIESQENGELARTNNLFKMWVMIPKLTEICWEAILTMHPQLPLYTAASLRRLGIPDRYVSRLNRSADVRT